MPNVESNDTAKVFMSGKSQAVRLPKKFRFTKGCDEVSVRQVGRHLILSPRFGDWDDYWDNSTRPSDDFVEAVLKRKESEMYGQVRAALKKQPIGPNNTWIAAHALSLQLPLVTNNTREFSRVPGLVIDTWMNLK